ncbi:uncharacterized protein [Triticum aestivum]|uniref:uncharacterized protein n=1 Tax=Triticum aestivum TaxID=4565 RepID=UPI001D0330C4|nr:uncharacterized protein LOC123073961 [Triticum aestivum]
MDSAMLSLTCAGLGAGEEDDDGGIVGYVKGDHCLDTTPTLLAFPCQGKPMSLEAHGPGGDRPEKPRRYEVTKMRSPCYSFRPAHHTLQVIVVKAATGKRGGFGTRQVIESMLSPPWKGLNSA